MAGLGASIAESDPDHLNIEEYLTAESIQQAPKKLQLSDLLNISPTLTEAAGAIIDDSFTRCFKSNSEEPWNWNIYLFPLWCFGVVIRYGFLFPLRAQAEKISCLNASLSTMAIVSLHVFLFDFRHLLIQKVLILHMPSKNL